MIGLAVLLAIGCYGRPTPSSVQAGSTFSLSLQGPLITPVGYSGIAHTDYQRGAIEVRLLTSTGPYPLVTRAVSTARAHPSSVVGEEGNNYPVDQTLVLVDVPATAPHGTYPLEVAHVYEDAQGQPQEDLIPVPVPYEIAILPSSIDVTRDDGLAETIVGSVADFESWLPWGWQNVQGNVPDSVPRPRLRFVFNPGVWAAEVSVTYPSGVISLRDVLEAPPGHVVHPAVTWLEDDQAGDATLHAAATDYPIVGLDLVFELVDGANAILDPAAVTLNVDAAWDADGSPIGSVAANIDGVY